MEEPNEASFSQIRKELSVDTSQNVLKLYVWVDPYQVDYGSSLLFVIASSEEEAKQLAKHGQAFSYGKFEQNDEFGWRDKIVDSLGSPDRVLTVPCAEWHEWVE